MNLRGLQSTWPPSVQAKSQVNPILCGSLHAGKCPARRAQRDVSLAHLDNDFAESGCSGDNGVQDRTQVNPVGILRIDQLVG